MDAGNRQTRRFGLVLRPVRARGRRRLIEASWPPPNLPPPEIRIFIDAWMVLTVWQETGAQMQEVSGDEYPVVDPGLQILTAPIQREGNCYSLEDNKWIVVSRVVPHRPIRIRAPERVIILRDPFLTWVTMLGRHIAAGFLPLSEMPRVRDLRLSKGIAITRDGPQFRY